MEIKAVESESNLGQLKEIFRLLPHLDFDDSFPLVTYLQPSNELALQAPAFKNTKRESIENKTGKRLWKR